MPRKFIQNNRGPLADFGASQLFHCRSIERRPPYLSKASNRKRGLELPLHPVLRYLCVFVTVIGSFCILHDGQAADTVQTARSAVLAPPDDARILMRWWWFGLAVVNAELEREMLQMKAGGIGGFEIQPVYPLALDDPPKNFQNYPYLSDRFLESLRYVNRRAQDLGLRVDLTLASGWPYGGPGIDAGHAAGALRVVRTPLLKDAVSAPLPALAAGESLIAAFGLPMLGADADPTQARQLPLPASGALRIELPEATTTREVWLFVSSRTGQMVKRAAIGAEGFVLDHFDRAAIEDHLRTVGDPLMTAFADKPPYSVFSDSLEVYDSDWTPDLLEQFKQRRGYDLTPYLPVLVAGKGDLARSIRHDWGETLTELVDENYLKPLTAWAHQHHTRFRSQTYGEPAVELSSNALVDLPEGEGPQWRTFSYTRWATSASHLYDHNVTSAEAWTWLHSPAFRATPLDMKAEADLFFLEGVNQFVGHGWPYTPPQVAEPGWAFYAAAVFNDHNPWWIVMPDVTAYLQRTSALLRQGHPANDVAIYVPTDDAWADFVPGHVALTDYVPNYITPALTAAILDAGYGFDYIDASAIDSGKLRSPILILPHVERISPSTYRKMVDYAAHGGKIIAVGRLPAHGTGVSSWKADSHEVAALSQTLFGDSSSSAIEVKDESAMADALHHAREAEVRFSPAAPELGFVHRKLEDGDLYFIANTSNHPVSSQTHLRAPGARAEVLDLIHQGMRTVSSDAIKLSLQPYESVAILLEDKNGKSAPQEPTPRQRRSIELNGDWLATFQGTHETRKTSLPHLWTTEPATAYYSGIVTYSRDFDVKEINPSSTWWIDFGEGTPIEPPSGKKLGTQALLEGPVREAAVIYVNGKRAGSVWCPPYRADLTALLRAGRNHLEIRVANTAINTLAGRSLPDNRLLNLRYGARFQAQDMENLQPVPSGISGPVRLIQEFSGVSVEIRK